MIILNTGMEMKCANCYWFNGEERECDVHENGHCYRWKRKDCSGV